MRHRKKTPKLSRTAAHRRALLSNLASALIINKKIKTTAVKAKFLRTYVEKMITKARREDLNSRRTVLKHIPHKDVVKELFDVIGPMYVDRPGGYTRITKIGQRISDSTEMAFIELLGFEGAYKEKRESLDDEKKKRKEKREAEAKAAQEEFEAQNAAATAEEEAK